MGLLQKIPLTATMINNNSKIPPHGAGASLSKTFFPFFQAQKLPAVYLIIAIFLLAPCPETAAKNFPIYPCMKPNVQFWEDVYSRYTTRQGILHDQDNLTVVYTVIDLVDWQTKGAARINKRLIKIARQYYKSILENLGKGKKPETDDEKRVAAMFPAHSRQAYRNARDNIRLQIGQKDRFLKGFIRSGKYMPEIKKIFRSRHLPVELAYLPHVESSFNPEAYSKAGAVGLWQFTGSTGRQYMRVDHIVDHRYDPYYATIAAAVFLKENYETLGSWPLAITAYNHGRNGMLRAAKKYGDYETIFNDLETKRFQFASRNFYSEFTAALNIARRLEKREDLIQERPEASFLVHLEGFARAEDIRNHFGISEEDFTRLNPALQKPVLEGKKFIPKGFYVRVPATEKTHDLAAAIPSHIYYSSQIRDEEYMVQRGDTAGAIARKYHISVAELITANGLNRRAMIRIGQRLKIPAGTKTQPSDPVVTLKSSSKNKPN